MKKLTMCMKKLTMCMKKLNMCMKKLKSFSPMQKGKKNDFLGIPFRAPSGTVFGKNKCMKKLKVYFQCV
jgi:hypothetical protein